MPKEVNRLGILNLAMMANEVSRVTAMLGDQFHRVALLTGDVNEIDLNHVRMLRSLLDEFNTNYDEEVTPCIEVGTKVVGAAPIQSVGLKVAK